ncbi:MAG: hypothetical protein CL927_08185 [Deltaproteobacteria bacterium]|nr:hypothetical protein [Deltaproteobacteria bacterium]
MPSWNRMGSAQAKSTAMAMWLARPEEVWMQKSTVIGAFRSVLAAELDAVERVAAMARDEVSSDETKQEGKYDTRATEASYLARGQAWRVAELRRLKAWFDVFDTERTTPETVGIGSLVEVDGTRSGWYLLGPVGGPTAEVDGVVVRLISPQSPMGRAMRGMEAEDAFEVTSPTGILDYEICRVL